MLNNYLYFLIFKNNILLINIFNKLKMEKLNTTNNSSKEKSDEKIKSLEHEVS